MGLPQDKGRYFGYKRSVFGKNGNGHQIIAFGDTVGKYLQWDNTNNVLNIVGDISINGSTLGAVSRISNLTAATLTVTSAYDGKVITLNKADGQAITLPAATGSGLKLEFIVVTTVTSVGTTIKVVGNDIMTGRATVLQDGGDTMVGFETASDSDTITLNGTTTGGIKGDKIELIDIATDLWHVNVMTSATSTEATPFSATVT
jgi:hypothetical protein